jgi:hypothetical protein
MKNIFCYLALATLLTLSLVSCENVLDKKNLENLVADDLWQDPTLLKGFMDNVMRNNLPDDSWAAVSNRLDVICDESYGQYDLGIPYDNIAMSEGGSANMGIGYIEQWNYNGIRNINKFLDNVDLCPEDKLPVALKNDYVAQMKTLRALRYFQMVRLYGGVPLLLHEQSPSDDLYVPREKTSVCFAQIIQDLDDAINMGDDFPMRRDDSNGGRINRAVALALKGRFLLYYASPQFASQTPAGTKDVNTRWTEAYNANKIAIEQLSANGYGLFRPTPDNHQEAIQNYIDMFAEEFEKDNPEIVWAKRFQWPVQTSVSFDGGTTLEMVNAYANADGSPYTNLEIPPAGSAAVSLGVYNVPFWIGREPRFYTAISYNGKAEPRYKLNPIEDDLDASGKQIHQWIFIGGASAPFTDCARLEVPGVTQSKMYDPEVNSTIPDGNHSGVDWPLIRYAEVLLNFAECAAKTNHEDEARQVLQSIRKRAGIPQGDNNYGIGNPTGEELILAILKERQIELAFEGFRFWDVRRWRLFTDPIAGYKLNGVMRHTMKAQPKTDINPETLLSINMDQPESYFNVFDNHIYTLDASPFVVSERQYFYRIAYEEHIKKNPKLQQTLLWENGTFNPYE